MSRATAVAFREMNVTLDLLTELAGEAEIRWLKKIGGKEDQMKQVI